MATAKQLLGGVTAITITGASLANAATRGSTLVVNTSNLYLDAIISGNLTLGATAATGNIYLTLTSSDATSVSSPGVSTDGAVTLPQVALASMESLSYGMIVPGTELIFLTKLQVQGIAAGAAVNYANLAISQAFNMGGLGLPPQWGINITNMSGFTLSATATVTNYNGVQQTIA